MKRLGLFIYFTCLTLCWVSAGNGNFSITPYISNEVAGMNITERVTKRLDSKLVQIITANEAYGGVDNRFVLTPRINIISQETTATIPSKTIIRIEIVFCVGDGISGTLFKSVTMEYSGVGDSLEDAILSAITKIRSTDLSLKSLIDASKDEIINYYNRVGNGLIQRAKSAATSQEYEDAISYLVRIPQGCTYYDEAQEQILRYSSMILKRENEKLLLQAKTAWIASPDYNGAEEASKFLSQICITDDNIKKETNLLIKGINSSLRNQQEKEYKLALREIDSNETIQLAEINTSAQVASSLIESIPQLAYNVIHWFLF